MYGPWGLLNWNFQFISAKAWKLTACIWKPSIWFESFHPSELDLTSFENSLKSREIQNSFQKMISGFKILCQKFQPSVYTNLQVVKAYFFGSHWLRVLGVFFFFFKKTVFQKMALTVWNISSENDVFHRMRCVFRSEWRILWRFWETKCKTLVVHITTLLPKVKVLHVTSGK